MKHSQSATVFEMDRGNKQLRPAILRAITSTQDESSTQTITLHTDIDLSPESNETAERRHLKSILKVKFCFYVVSKKKIQSAQVLLKLEPVSPNYVCPVG